MLNFISGMPEEGLWSPGQDAATVATQNTKNTSVSFLLKVYN
jgi:hypothetical protein